MRLKPIRGVMDLSAILVGYNIREFLKWYLYWIFPNQIKIKYETFIVDNNSQAGWNQGNARDGFSKYKFDGFIRESCFSRRRIKESALQKDANTAAK